MNLLELGLLDFSNSLAIQERCLKKLEEDRQETLIILEHPKTITLGRNSQDSDLKQSALSLKENNIEVLKIKRGGRATCHMPGQLVIYPIMKVIGRSGGLKQFVYDLEEVLIETLKHYNIQGKRKQNSAGIWLENGKKIAFIGLGLKKGLSYHGCSLNVENSFELFEAIIPCADPNAKLTSISYEAGKNISVDEVKEVYKAKFNTVFKTHFNITKNK
ncbi:lipoyl(octanoyl) transferase LipB [Desulfovibrio litoralis]|uniref:Octanoyltransferase n=1 Tax=Desulfovibrio litoralis DSM 11393 TaxID=1121455 RepID=A0A1M7RTN6_9BACT|nr:lipoyl(octanoyl) transferase LipB [Desulfovibrio litoralis]SHN49496.1 lipoyl(octanoyl) transferase [Desulfovibrio litoralis DSM 11393]